MQYYTNKDFKKILSEYPDEVTKKQFYRLCHVSKRVASYYLEQGFLPCEKRKSKTHKYIIKTADIVIFLRKRQEDPCAFQVPAGTSRKSVETEGAIKHRVSKERPVDLTLWREYLNETLAEFSDVCEVREICRLCGYSKETVLKWCEAKKFIFFNINRTYQIPKKSFMDFMASTEFATIIQKSARHSELLKDFEKTQMRSQTEQL
ncbi:MAG: helix-turn-helix domain-containing protein [Lachnospiraceae bacterium]|jgi:hypothetical protein|nr:helix-turn-helix domain-containing protein [Lachnospiraceae bacterium]